VISLTKGNTEVKDEAPSEHLDEVSPYFQSSNLRIEPPRASPLNMWVLTPVIGLIAIVFDMRTLRESSLLWFLVVGWIEAEVGIA
jgi:hypothetical protein